MLQDVEKIFFAFFWRNDPLRENFQNSVPKRFIPQRSTCFSNFVKFGRQKIGKFVRYLTEKNSSGSPALATACTNRTQNLSQPVAENVLRVFQISSKSAHFRRSYIRTREHRQSALESESNIRLKPSFEPNNEHVLREHTIQY